MIEFRLPSLGSDMDQGKLLEWKVRPGDVVTRGQVIAVVDTAKAAVDVESWEPGTVWQLLAQPGETMPVGTVMATLLAPGETAPAAEFSRPASPPGKPDSAATPAPSLPAREATIPLSGPAPTVLHKPSSPAARRRARELGVDIEKLAGTGPHGVINIADVERAAAAVMSPPAAPSTRPIAAPIAADRATEMRKAIAAAMTRSKREIPHYYLAETICLRKATDWLAACNAGRPLAERLLMGALQLKAAAIALKRFPDLNGFWKDAAFQPATGVHIGVAISLRQGGLIAPAIHDVDRLALAELMHALADLVTRARAGSLRSSEMSDATVTVTNLGEQGVEVVHGVIYPPQVALIGFGRVAMRPWAEKNALSAEPVVVASLAADHRASDGHRGARFLSALNEALQYPEDL